LPAPDKRAPSPSQQPSGKPQLLIPEPNARPASRSAAPRAHAWTEEGRRRAVIFISGVLILVSGAAGADKDGQEARRKIGTGLFPVCKIIKFEHFLLMKPQNHHKYQQVICDAD
jgi:hypothetical protein